MWWWSRVIFAYLCIIVSVNQRISHPHGSTSPYCVPNGVSSGGLESEECPWSDADAKSLESHARANSNSGSKWISKDLSNFDIERFLTGNGQDPRLAAKAIIAHSHWRSSPNGADAALAREQHFLRSPLNKEIFWMGKNARGCPTIVIRSNFHDGRNYNDDPEEYANFFIYLAEKGRKLYGLGRDERICVIVDRYAQNPEIQSADANPLDMRFIPALMATFRHLHAVMQVNYPDILQDVIVVPSTWFSRTCFSILSKLVDSEMRRKFRMVASDDIEKVMGEYFTPDRIPPYLGGTSETYGGSCEMCVLRPEMKATSAKLTRGGALPQGDADVLGQVGDEEPHDGQYAPPTVPGRAWRWIASHLDNPPVPASSTQLEQYLSMAW